MEYLYVRVVKAKVLPGKFTVRCDPYVEVRLGKYKVKTRHFELNSQPEWNQVFAFSKDWKQASSLEVIVYDKDFVVDEFIGRVLFDLNSVLKGVPPDRPLAPQWYSLEDGNGMKARGKLMLAVWKGTIADEAFPEACNLDDAAVSGADNIFHENIHTLLTHCHVCFKYITPTNNPIYVCSECKIFLQKTWAELPKKTKHPLDPLHPLTLDQAVEVQWRPLPGDRCRMCGDYLKGLVYRCSHCEIVMDPKCALSQPITMMSSSHRHPLVLIDAKARILKCSECGEYCSSTFFCCTPCKLVLHARCLSRLPTKLHSIHHRHLLTLTYSPIKDSSDEDDDAEFYCDNCEEQRDLYEPTYFCEECHFVSHVHCVLTEVMRLLKEQWLADGKVEDTKFEEEEEEFVDIDENLAKLNARKDLLTVEKKQVEERLESLTGEFNSVEEMILELEMDRAFKERASFYT